jgi:Carbohydrate-selective porin, OprB family/S-layer homology domain
MKSFNLYLLSSFLCLTVVTKVNPAFAQTEVDPSSNNTEIESQITSVSQLSDVQPNEWAFQALQSLVERYGVIAGYPDRTFKGDRAMTRYEFAAGLNAALDRVNKLIQLGFADRVKKEDLVMLQRLQEEFSAELATLRGRVDTLETRTAQLEANQFSTTTKLTGQAIFGINAGIQSDANNPNATFFSRNRLNLETSFTGKDLLFTQLQAGTGSKTSDAAAFLQQEEGDFRNRLVRFGENLLQEKFEKLFFPLDVLGVTLDDLGLGLSKLENVDAIRDTLAGTVATQDLEAGASREEALRNRQNLIDAIDTSRTLNNFLQTNSRLDYSNVDSGLKLNRLSYTFPVYDDLRVSVFPQGYISDYIDKNNFANNSAGNFSTYGLINNQLLLAQDIPGAGAAFSWNPGKGGFTIRGAYRAEQAALANSSSTSGDKQGGLFGKPNLGAVELEISPSKTFALRFQYSGGTQDDEEYDAIGANLEVALGQKLGLFGRFGYAYNFKSDIKPTSWSAGIVFPDLFAKGALAGFSIGQPLIFQEKDNLLGFFSRTQTNYEAFYRLPVNDNISISPVFQVISDPGNTRANTIYTGTLRTVFSF